jgi:hypothetical protein
MRDNSHYLAGVLAASSQIRELLASTREIIAASKKILAEPAPSTFLGRKSFEPFEREDQPSRPIPRIEVAEV